MSASPDRSIVPSSTLEPPPSLSSQSTAGEPAAVGTQPPATLTITRTSEEDFKSRQLEVSIDGEHVATLLFGDSVTRELPPGRHRIRVHNTLVWKTADVVLKPGEQVFFEAINRAGYSTYLLMPAFGIGPLFVTLRRM